MGPTRTMAFQMPEEMFQRLKDYLRRHNITQKDFVLGLVEAELKRDQELRAETVNELNKARDGEDEDEAESEDFDEELDDEESEYEEEELDDEESEDEDEEQNESESVSDEAFSMAM